MIHPIDKLFRVKIFISVMVICIAIFNSPASFAAATCQESIVESNIQCLSPMGPCSGVAQVTLADGTVRFVNAAARITDLDVRKDGGFVITGAELDDWGNGDITIGHDTITLKPTDHPGVFDAKVKVIVEGKSGNFKNTFGMVKGKGTMSFIDLKLSYKGKANVCAKSF